MTDEQPTIPQIVRALTTLNDRHSDQLRALEAEHQKELSALQSRFGAVDEALVGRDCLVDALEKVIATLCSRIERTHQQLQRDNAQCVYSEPLELMNLLGRIPDPAKLSREAREKAREAKKAELKRQAEQQVRDEMIASGSRQCACGKWWRKGQFAPPGHNTDECFRPCRVCGHKEDSHVEELPEEGGRTYCTEDAGMSHFQAGPHTYDGAILAEWDRCMCGHDRREHRHVGPEGAYCHVCRPEHGRQHEFALKR